MAESKDRLTKLILWLLLLAVAVSVVWTFLVNQSNNIVTTFIDKLVIALAVFLIAPAVIYITYSIIVDTLKNRWHDYSGKEKLYYFISKLTQFSGVFFFIDRNEHYTFTYIAFALLAVSLFLHLRLTVKNKPAS